MNVLVTGGAGYIGSHTCVELLSLGCSITVADNLSNGSVEALKRVSEFAGGDLSFFDVDVRKFVEIKKIMKERRFDAVIHFAGLKSVEESNFNPVKYYDNNVGGTIFLLKAMEEVGLKKLVFSSSATVYGQPDTLPIPEGAPTSAINPYGQSKLMVENILSDLAKSDPEWKIANLRYFNPVGAHESGLIGENPKGIPNNLMPYITQVAVGIREKLSIFGGDYDTVDGTGVRDYIHVVDLAKGHVAALNYLFSDESDGFSSFNLGRGEGISVLQLVRAFEKASNKPVPYEIVDRRQGDVAECFADSSKAQKVLGWRAELGVERMCRDAWRWQVNNPNGY